MFRSTRSFVVLASAVVAVGLAACGGDDEGSEASAIAGLDIDTCAEVEYGGDDEPAGLIVSDLPMQGDSAERSSQQVDAIKLVLDQRDWKAGDTPVAFQACDDSIESTGLWDAKTCRSNAEAYGDDDQVLGVIGTYNSGCAAEEIPILNKADVAMISPGNTAVCLTEPSATCEDGQPDSLYPGGKRNYARVVPNDAFQGAALAEFAKRQGIEHPFVLYAADDPTSTGQAENFRAAAESLGLDIAGFETWDPKAKDYGDLFEQARREGSDGVVLAGLTEQNGAEVIRSKAEVLGPNRRVPLLAFDGFAQQSTIDQAGHAAHEMFASVPGSAPDALSGEGAELVDELEADFEGTPVEQFAPYAGEAAAVLLDAIDQGGTDRAAIIDAVFATQGGGGILDSYDIEPTGDPSVGPITILQADIAFEPTDEISPAPDLVKAARG